MDRAEDAKMAIEVEDQTRASYDDGSRKHSVVTKAGELINASGHRDQLERHYGLLSICGLAIAVDNAWVALGTTVSLAIGEISRFSAASLL